MGKTEKMNSDTFRTAYIYQRNSHFNGVTYPLVGSSKQSCRIIHFRRLSHLYDKENHSTHVPIIKGEGLVFKYIISKHRCLHIETLFERK